ncbi:50S ribosomal protein L17 [Marinoscillum sp. MHG1-6]|uniref:50S ribosomal protein L17 n=1 Tax=Marinoscillum sp. MHG1-6 TaxID=2959627 RepID=UPI00215722C2|nr:50S ribosomal protein L17 [Marinoscillum sp. MHG1-6]
MRHGKKFNHLGRTASHRSAMLSNMATSLILHKRINTTVAKAKALRKYIEPIITKSKDDSTHSRRVAFSYLQNKESVTELFSTVAEKVAARPGGYTRIIKTGIRQGDNAEMCMMELVDFNELLLGSTDSAKAKTRRSRRSTAKKTEAAAPVVEEAEVIEEPKAEAVVEEAPVAEDAPAAEADTTEEAPEAKADDSEEKKD